MRTLLNFFVRSRFSWNMREDMEASTSTYSGETSRCASIATGASSLSVVRTPTMYFFPNTMPELLERMVDGEEKGARARCDQRAPDRGRRRAKEKSKHSVPHARFERSREKAARGLEAAALHVQDKGLKLEEDGPICFRQSLGRQRSLNLRRADGVMRCKQPHACGGQRRSMSCRLGGAARLGPPRRAAGLLPTSSAVPVRFRSLMFSPKTAQRPEQDDVVT